MRSDRHNIKVDYDAEADVLSIEGSPHVAIDHARELGNLVVHFGKNDEPVLIEVLEASHSLRGQTRPFAEIAELAFKS